MKTTVARIYGLEEALNPKTIGWSRQAMRATKAALRLGSRMAHETAADENNRAAVFHQSTLEHGGQLTNKEVETHRRMKVFHFHLAHRHMIKAEELRKKEGTLTPPPHTLKYWPNAKMKHAVNKAFK